MTESDLLYRQLLENSGEAIFIAQDYMLKYVNPKTVELLGYTKEDLCSRPFIEFIYKEDRIYVMENHQKRINGSFIPHIYQFRIIHRNGSIRWVELNAILFRWGERPATLNFVVDVTERKKMEESLKSGREILSLAAELSKIGPWEYDFKTGNFIFSDEFYSIYGTSAAIEGRIMSAEKYAAEFLYPEDAAKVKEEIERGLASSTGEYTARFERRIIRRDGEMRIIAVLIKILKNSSGEIIKWYGVNQDITDQKLVEEKLKHLINEKEILLIELQHRVKNNLNIISSLLNLGIDKIADEKSKSVFSDAISRIHSMSHIYGQLYSSKDLEKFDLNFYIRNLTNSIFRTYKINQNKNRLIIDVDNIDFDLKKMIPVGLILNELITNSLKYAYPFDTGGEIRVSIKKSGERVALQVSDDGIGMPDDFNVSESSSVGLMLVSILAKQIHGEMSIAGGSGVTVSVKFSL